MTSGSIGSRPSPERTAALRRSIRYAIADSIVAQPIVTIAQPATIALPVNVYLATLFTKGFGLPAAAIGFITALPFACQVLQLPVSPFIARWCSAKFATLLMVVLQLAMWVALAVAMPWIPRDDPATAASCIGGLYFLSCLFGSIGGVAWSSWLHEWVPQRLLGTFFARRNRLAQCASLACLVGTGWVLVAFDYDVRAFQAVIAIAGVLRVASFLLLWRSPAPAAVTRIEQPRPLREQLRSVRASRPFVVAILCGALWAVASSAFGPFYNVFMFEQLGFSAVEISVCATLFVSGGILSLPAWGRLIDRHGHKPALIASLLLWQVPNFLWSMLTPANHGIVYVLWIATGLSSAGVVLGQFTLMLKLVPAEAKSFGLALFIALTSVAGTAAPALGGMTLDWSLAHWPTHTLAIYHACFLFQPLVALASCVLLQRLDEPRARRFSEMVGQWLRPVWPRAAVRPAATS